MAFGRRTSTFDPPLYWWQEIVVALGRINDRLNHITNRLGRLMALVSIEQEELDRIGGVVSTVADDLKFIIENPNPLAPADEAVLLAAVDKLQALDVKPTPPVEPPVPEPTT